MAHLKEEISDFVCLVQEIVNEHYDSRFPELPVPNITAKFGRKYAKIIKETSNGALGRTQKSVYGFVDAHTGDIYKAASWKAPAKHIRASIFDADGGKSVCGPYGIAYLVNTK